MLNVAHSANAALNPNLEVTPMVSAVAEIVSAKGSAGS